VPCLRASDAKRTPMLVSFDQLVATNNTTHTNAQATVSSRRRPLLFTFLRATTAPSSPSWTSSVPVRHSKRQASAGVNQTCANSQMRWRSSFASRLSVHERPTCRRSCTPVVVVVGDDAYITLGVVTANVVCKGMGCLRSPLVEGDCGCRNKEVTCAESA
jgi:hypothetical protein